MTSILVDSNVVLDVITDVGPWAAWSSKSLAEAGAAHQLITNQVVFAEVSVAFARIEEAEAVFAHLVFQRESVPFEAAFLAGKAFREYRRRGGTRTAPLPDFFIGAHAAVAGHRLLTRDPARFRTYFPKLDLISPDRLPQG
jgi:predicted nucleic acid-binding protein